MSVFTSISNAFSKLFDKPAEDIPAETLASARYKFGKSICPYCDVFSGFEAVSADDESIRMCRHCGEMLEIDAEGNLVDLKGFHPQIRRQYCLKRDYENARRMAAYRADQNGRAA